MTVNNVWIAKKSEYRLILITTGICIAFVITALIWPEPSKETDPAEPEVGQATIFKLPPRPIQPLPPEEKEISKEPELQTRDIDTPSVEPVKVAKPSPVVKQTPIAKTPRHGFYIQVAAFKDPARARAQAGKLRQNGWKVDIVIKGGDMHAVWVGPWQSRTDADKGKARLLKELNLKGFMINK